MIFDTILKNGSVIDTEKRSITICDVGIVDGKIAFIGKLSDSIATTYVDCYNKIVAPSFIDAHVHIESSMVSPMEFSKAVLANGTTAVIADPHEIVNVGGVSALDTFLDMCKQSVIDIFTVVPSSVPATPFDANGAGEFLAQDMKKYVERDDIVGLGEVMCYPEVLQNDKKILDKIDLFKHKTIDGHTAGLDAESLKKYAQAGIQNDHESSTFDEAKLRLDCGMNVYIREGSAARNLDAIVNGLLKHNERAKAHECAEIKVLDIQNFAFCTDDKHLSTIGNEGHISYNVRRAIELQMSIIDAVTIASLNPAKFYRLTDRGNLAVGMLADIVVLSDDKASSVDVVLKNGKIVAESQKLVFTELKEADKTPYLYNSVKCKQFCEKDLENESSQNLVNNSNTNNSVKYKQFCESDFAIEIKPQNLAIELQIGQLITNKVILSKEQVKDANILATIERHGKTGNFSLCHLVGFGIQNGAVATSVSHDSHNTVVAGDNGQDMAIAVNHLREIGGGYVIASSGEIVGELPLEIGGLMSEKSASIVQNTLDKLDKIARSLGVCDGIDPFTTLSFVALPVIPHLRLLESGLFDVDNMCFVK